MTFTKILVPFVSLVVMAYSSEIGESLFAYSFIPYGVTHDLERGWRYCPGNATYTETYKPLLDEASRCFRNLTMGTQSICHNLEDRVQKCSQPLVEFFVDCFSEESKDLPPAISKAATSLVEAFCTSPGDLLLEIMNPCIPEFLNHRNKTIKEECRADRFQPRLDKFERDMPSKAEACKLFQEIGDCWQFYVNQDCASAASKNFFSKFYNAALAGCK